MQEKLPPAPVNVRLVRPDGEEVPVSCVFVGYKDDIAVWRVVDPPEGPWHGGYIEALPTKTAIEF